MWEDFIFGDTTYQLNKNKNIKLRKPSELPDDDDIFVFRSHILKRMKELTAEFFEFFDTSSYVKLRDCACARLTMLNGRRGGEPARLLINEFNQAVNDSWIDKQRLSNLDDLEQSLVDHLKITYMCGKGNNHLVPIIIPPDTMPSLKKLADPIVCKEVDILQSNAFLFAITKQSEGYTSGWHSVHNIISVLSLKKPENIKATSNRHRVSTLFSNLDLPKKDRELFYKHMGHSAAINEGTYQVPPALMEITKVGKHLLDFDCSKSARNETHPACKNNKNPKSQLQVQHHVRKTWQKMLFLKSKLIR
ncbi:uncharacterized protein LOC136079814 [Hydra vulgaris]|uniref:Uncharacterized protein LOC136079814 n=1 Tax=Hydra vulgaris TaxID=6087 RepID=A0ABM4BTH9_HYDVU